MKIQEYMDLINDWDSSVPMSSSILISKGVRQLLTDYPQYNEASEITADALKKLKDIISSENGPTEADEAFIYIDGFIGQPKE